MRLPDGRMLGYAEYGDPGGIPVFSFHGGVSSRLDAAALAGAARRLGIRIVSPDRPGIGLSDRQPGRVLVDWPADVTALADHLHLDRFAVLGWSAGGPHAAACAAMLPGRVRAGALLGSVIPLDTPGSRTALDRPDRLLLRLSQRAPWAAGLALRWWVAKPSPESLLGSMIGELAGADAVVLERLGSPEQVTAFMRESVRTGTAGVIDDYRVIGEPWGFDPATITAPIRIWQGGSDTMVPPFFARWLGTRIPRSTVRVVRGEGHISLQHNRGYDILADLVTAA
jgi:pimeloyl-ACP methyl ester carboxylesterase